MTREHIIAEIKRTAEQNGGVPVGVRRFFTETGIRQTAWSGRYWLRWSDALREAGFSPNAFIEGYSDDDLFDKLASFARELDHFPIRSEIVMKSRSDDTFPSEKTFRRFGSKRDLATKLRAYCVAHDYSDVVSLCDSIVSTSRAQNEDAEPVSSAETFGFVYMIKYGASYKIGRTNALGRRERELAIQLPEKTKVIHSIRTDDPVGIEEYWHKRFHDRRKNGEWFALTPQDVMTFRRRKFM